MESPARALPYADRIQRAFGDHDVGAIRAHIAGESIVAEAGARAFTAGAHTVFGAEPDLYTVAHEAAHAVQQGFGRAPRSDEGPRGAALERHADAVAASVV